MALSPEIISKIENSFAAQPMMATLGATIKTIDEGCVTLICPIRDTCTQQHGYGHAALTFGIGDSAAGYAALSVMPADCEVLTTEMKINLLAPAQGGHLRAEGRVIKSGRRLVIVQSDVYAQDPHGKDRHIAILTGTMMPVPRP